ncbi:MAG: macro domain-containing protein [Nitrospinae bacterium]|nr:macro domain-containing protein [Nitrospinota bacterium]
MIELKRGDILKQEAEALVNTVNCVGVMGRGVALQFRKASPENYKSYREACARGEIQPGRMFVFDLNRIVNPRLIINFPTKRHWKGKSRLEDVRAGLQDLVEVLRRHKVRSVAVPPLGCGLGGLAWRTVRPLIEKALGALPDLNVYLFEPAGAPPAERIVNRTTRAKMTPGRAALLGLIQRYLGGLMDVSISLLEIHKLMYFLQEAGEPLRLRFAKALYGPYAQNLRHVLNAIEGHFTSGFGAGEDAPDKQIELIGDAARQSDAFLTAHPNTRERFDRVSELIAGFETPFGMELLATVHWVARYEGVASVDEAVEWTYAWGERKRMFTAEQIRIAWQALTERGWLKAHET